MKHIYNPQGNTAGPHIREVWTSQDIMKHVLIALIFPTIAAIYYFGLSTLVMISFSIGMCILLEVLSCNILKLKGDIKDYSAIVTGWLLALTLPISAPLWTLLVGDFIAIVIVKQLSGGLGRNWLNPAVTARVVLKLFFSPWITNWVTPQPDVMATATPLASLGHFNREISSSIPEWWKLFLGVDLGGPIGETCKLAVLLSFLYLVSKKVIHLWIPLFTVGTFFVTVLLYSGMNFQFAIAHVFSGALIFAAVFMVTDYTTTPITDKGKYLFSMYCGILCALLRIILDLPGGIGIAILVMNLFTPLIDKCSLHKIYGIDGNPKVNYKN
ncbi:RnfABCDGE type electron transport complex subunit D [Enterococcus faecalis]|uniref:RnfABCDGE type electron transport complex subunit D n=1 Tax=Enterococcus faecalis TaxID=1351 RepID=UPI003D0D89EF